MRLIWYVRGAMLVIAFSAIGKGFTYNPAGFLYFSWCFIGCSILWTMAQAIDAEREEVVKRGKNV